MSARISSPKAPVWILGALLLLPFILYGTLLERPVEFVGMLLVVAFGIVLILNFEAGLLAILAGRSSLDYLNNFGEGAAASLAGIISVGLILAGLFYILYRKCNILAFEESKPFLVFLGICGVSIVYSPNFQASLADWLRLVSVFSVYVLVRLVFDTEPKLKKALTVILFSVLVPVALGCYQLITGSGTIVDAGQARIVGSFVHPNAFASYLFVILMILLPQIFEGKYFINKAFVRVAAIVTLGVFTLTLSRGAWIVFVLAMVLLGLLRYRRLLLILPLFLILAVVAVPPVQQRIANIFEPSKYAAGRSAWDWRLETWEEVSPLIERRPVFGNGLSTIEVEFGVLTHNDYLRLLAEVGILGLLAYLFLMGSTLRRTWKDYKARHTELEKSLYLGAVVLIFAFLIREFADNTLRNTVVLIYFWAVIAILRNMSALSREPADTNEVANV